MFTDRLWAAVLAASLSGALLSCGGSQPTPAATVPAPAIQSISPTVVTLGTTNVTLTVTGSNFVQGSTVLLNGTSLPTTFVSSTQLMATVPSTSLTGASSSATITVSTPGATGGGTSSSLPLAVQNPTPTVNSLSPTAVVVGGVGFTLTVNGTNFVSGATVFVNGASRVTTFVSATQLTAAILASDLTSAGALTSITVQNPAPNAGTSTSSVALTVLNPTPAVSSLSPTAVVAGTGGFTLIVNGSNFISGATVFLNGTSRVTTFVDSGQLTVAILPSDVTGSAGTLRTVRVQNPTPTPGFSNSASFTLENPATTIASITPTSQLAGTRGTIQITGTGFVPGAIVQLGSQTLSPQFISSTSLSVDVPTFYEVGKLSLTVANPEPNAGESNAVTFDNTAAGTGVSLVVASIDPDGNTVDSPGFISSNGRYFAFANLMRDTCLGADCNPSTNQYADSPFGGIDFTRMAGTPTPDGAYVPSSVQPDGPGTPGDLEFSTTCVGASSDCFTNTQVLLSPPIFGISSITADGRYIAYSTGTSEDSDYPGFIFDTCTGGPIDCAQVAIGITNSAISVPYVGSAARYSVYAREASESSNVILHEAALETTQGWITGDTVLSDPNQTCTKPIMSSDAAFIAYTCTTQGLSEVFYQSTCVNGDGRCNFIAHQVSFGDSDSSQNSSVSGISVGGRFVTYTTENASVGGQSLGYRMVFVYDTCKGVASGCTPKSVPVCLNVNGAVADSDCTGGQISDDGQYIAIYSEASNLVTDVFGASYIASNPLK